MPRDAEHYLRQAKSKVRIQAAREWREVMRGERLVLPQSGGDRIALEAIRCALKNAEGITQ